MNWKLIFLLPLLCLSCSDSDPTNDAIRISINSGGRAFDFEIKEWIADDFTDATQSFINEIAIEGTQNDTLYHTEASSASTFTYEIPVSSPGPYLVELHFAEIFHGISNANGVGARIFDVDIENGQGQLNNYDIIATTGAPATAIKENFPDIQVTDGFVSIVFIAVVGEPKVAGVEVSVEP